MWIVHLFIDREQVPVTGGKDEPNIVNYADIGTDMTTRKSERKDT